MRLLGRGETEGADKRRDGPGEGGGLDGRREGSVPVDLELDGVVVDLAIFFHLREREGEGEGERDRQTDRRTDREERENNQQRLRLAQGAMCLTILGSAGPP